MRSLSGIGTLAFSLAAAAAHAQEISPADLFGAREGVEQISLSPDGSKVAFLSPRAGQGSVVQIAPLDASVAPKAIIGTDGDPDRMWGCKWANDTRLVCTLYGVVKLDSAGPAYYIRQVALDDDGGNRRLLVDRGGSGDPLGFALNDGSVIDWWSNDGTVLTTRKFIPETTTGTLLAQTKEGLGVVKIDTRTLAATLVEEPRRDASEYITDGRGNVRIMGIRTVAGATGLDRGETKYLYRTRKSRDWKDLSTVTDSGEAFNPYAVDPELDIAYGLKKLNGRMAAYAMSLDGSRKESLLFAHSEVDVDGFVEVGRERRVVGARYATERPQAEYFDPELKKLMASLGKAIPHLPLIRIVDASSDSSKLLIWAGSDDNPGRYYLYDRKAKKLGEVLAVRPELEKVRLATVQPVSYPASDGTKVPAYLTLPPGRADAKGLPAIVMPHGGPGSRDVWGFDWLSQYFANRGYAVLQPNFRGSAGYGDSWFQRNGFQNWRLAIGDVNDGGRWLTAQGADPSKLAIFGWSYGGYAALQSSVTEPGLFKAVVAVAPVTDLDMLKQESRGWSNARLVRDYIGSGGHVEEGSPARHAAKIKVPVLLFHGTYDGNVGVEQSRVLVDRLKDTGAVAELTIYEKLDHYLADSKVRSDMLAKSEAFLARALGQQTQ